MGFEPPTSCLPCTHSNQPMNVSAWQWDVLNGLQDQVTKKGTSHCQVVCNRQVQITLKANCLFFLNFHPCSELIFGLQPSSVTTYIIRWIKSWLIRTQNLPTSFAWRFLQCKKMYKLMKYWFVFWCYVQSLKFDFIYSVDGLWQP